MGPIDTENNEVCLRDKTDHKYRMSMTPCTGQNKHNLGTVTSNSISADKAVRVADGEQIVILKEICLERTCSQAALQRFCLERSLCALACTRGSPVTQGKLHTVMLGWALVHLSAMSGGELSHLVGHGEVSGNAVNIRCNWQFSYPSALRAHRTCNEPCQGKYI